MLPTKILSIERIKIKAREFIKYGNACFIRIKNVFRSSKLSERCIYFFSNIRYTIIGDSKILIFAKIIVAAKLSVIRYVIKAVSGNKKVLNMQLIERYLFCFFRIVIDALY